MALVDPIVSRAKFALELAQYQQLEDDYRRQGWWMLKAEFPEIFVAFVSPKTKPPAVVFGAVLDFTDYDLVPPSVKLVNPFTREPYQHKALPTKLPRRAASPVPPPAGIPMGAIVYAEQELMQAHDPEHVPFLCLPGVREYHDHPAHTGDSWLPHRQGGEGTLHFILEKLARYGLEPVTGVQVELRFHVSDFQKTPAPE